MIFRLDDVQTDYGKDASKELIDIFISKKAPICLGIVGGAFWKTNRNDPLTLAVRKCVNQ